MTQLSNSTESFNSRLNYAEQSVTQNTGHLKSSSQRNKMKKKKKNEDSLEKKRQPIEPMEHNQKKYLFYGQSRRRTERERDRKYI